jgi:hypothetical protein
VPLGGGCSRAQVSGEREGERGKEAVRLRAGPSMGEAGGGGLSQGHRMLWRRSQGAIPMLGQSRAGSYIN